MADTSEFMQRVQLHERTWGHETYPGRPQLDQILRAKVVAIWRVPHKKDGDRWVVSTHPDLSYLEKFFLSQIFRFKAGLGDDRKFICAYEDGVKLSIKGVRLIIEKDTQGTE